MRTTRAKGEEIKVDFYGSTAKISTKDKTTVAINSPACIEIDSDCNEVEVVLANTLGNEFVKDYMSQYSKIPSCGIRGITVLK